MSLLQKKVQQLVDLMKLPDWKVRSFGLEGSYLISFYHKGFRFYPSNEEMEKITSATWDMFDGNVRNLKLFRTVELDQLMLTLDHVIHEVTQEG